jgi:hypothetical protein
MKRRSFLQVLAGTLASLPLLALLPTRAESRSREWLIQWQGPPRNPEPPTTYRVEIYDASGRLAGVKTVDTLNQFSFQVPHSEQVRVRLVPDS